MKKRNRLILTAIAVLLAIGAVVLTSSASDGKKKVPAPTCCKKMEGKCGPESKKNRTGELIMDNMSRQFISIFPFTY